MPFPPKVAEIVREFQPNGTSFLDDLGRFIFQRYGVEVSAASWPADALPAHLRARVEILDDRQKTIGAGRDLNSLRQQLEKIKVEPEKPAVDWQRVAQKWERFALTTWNFGDLPERVTVLEDPTFPVFGWPGLEIEQGRVNVGLFRTQNAARKSTLGGVQKLVELAVQKDLGWIEIDLRALTRFSALYAPIGSVEELQESALEHLKRYILPYDFPFPLTHSNFQIAVEEARRKIPGITPPFLDRVNAVLQLHQQVRVRVGAPGKGASAPKTKLTDFSQLGISNSGPQPANPLALELAALMPSRFLEKISFERLPHLPRYLKALLIRAERAALNPAKDQERARQIFPYLEALKKIQATQEMSAEKNRLAEEFRWLIEEFKVSIFAQELGTAVPVSAKRLDQHFERWRASE
jgi:ATP-dependent helicase HrpA